MSYGEKIKEIRRAHLLSQEEFAKKLGVSRSIVSQVEINRIKPTVDALKKVASVFNVSLDYLMQVEKLKKENIAYAFPDAASLHRQKILLAEEPQPEMVAMYMKSGMGNNASIQIKPEENAEQEKLTLIPYMSLVKSEEYLKEGYEGFIKSPHPQLQLPIHEKGILMAFELQNSIEQETTTVVCHKININDLGLPASVVSVLENTFVYGTVNTINATTIMINNIEYAITDLRELWLVDMHLQKGGEREEREDIQKRLDRIEELLMNLQKKKAKKKKK